MKSPFLREHTSRWGYLCSVTIQCGNWLQSVGILGTKDRSNNPIANLTKLPPFEGGNQGSMLGQTTNMVPPVSVEGMGESDCDLKVCRLDPHPATPWFSNHDIQNPPRPSLAYPVTS